MNITPYQALKRMRELSELGIHFSFTFKSLNTTTGESKGFVTVEKALLRQGLKKGMNKQSSELIGYIDSNNNNAKRFFHLPMLMRFNEYTIKP